MLTYLAYFGAFGALGLAHWMRGAFGYPTIEQILYHVYFSDDAAVRMGGLFALTFAVEVLLLPLAATALAGWLHRGALRRWPGWPRKVVHALPHAGMVASTAALLLQFSVFSYAAAHLQPDRFAEAYVEPRSVRIDPGPRRNLVLVYVESLEATYGDAALFGRDLLAPLHALGGTSFAGYRPANGTAWTIAGIVSSQCGVPLLVVSPFDMRHREGERSFLPGATCLGDVLKAHGYRNVFLGGASLSFAGKGTFLRDHGYDEVWGREEWLKAGTGPGEINFWGLSDDGLLARARTRLDALHAAGQPFNLTLLTLDTHGPDGFPSPRCRQQGLAESFDGILTCTGQQLAEFARYMQQRGYLKDTTLVIMGDHLAAGTPLDAKLEQSRNRRIFNLMLAEPAVRPNRQELVPFDMYPTLVELLGMEVAGDRLGLGASAVGPAAASAMKPLEPAALRGLGGSAAYGALWEPAAR